MLNEAEDRLARLSRPQIYLLLFLRIVVGWHFLSEGLAKLLSPGWSAAGYLEVSRWLFSGVFHWIAATPAVLKVVDFLNIWGLILIGLGLMLGCLTRVAAIAGILLLAVYYVANPPLIGVGLALPTEGSYLIIDKNIVELFALAVLAVFPTGTYWGLDRLILGKKEEKPKTGVPGDIRRESAEPDRLLSPKPSRRELIQSLGGVPFLGAFAVAVIRKEHWKSYEAKNLIDAVTNASTKALDVASLKDLKGKIPHGEIKGTAFSRLILGGNILSGYTHARDLIYVSKLVKAYHNKERIFATLLLGEKCGINTLLTNPILATLIDEYWKRKIGKIQWISDCVALNYDEKGAHAIPYQQFLDRIKRAIDYGACACYVQGETADYFIRQGQPDSIAKALDFIRQHRIIAGIGAHDIETIQACVKAGFEPDFWMKTLHHHKYWSARHPEWHDNMYCNKPAETIDFMKTLKQPWIAFKVLAAGAIPPKDGFRYAFENGADFVCAGTYDFQMVDNVNSTLDILKSDLKRERPWMGGPLIA
jgi:uncharacterized membrane protein YphA (DoxX/SURF4 family)